MPKHLGHCMTLIALCCSAVRAQTDKMNCTPLIPPSIAKHARRANSAERPPSIHQAISAECNFLDIHTKMGIWQKMLQKMLGAARRALGRHCSMDALRVLSRLFSPSMLGNAYQLERKFSCCKIVNMKLL